MKIREVVVRGHGEVALEESELPDRVERGALLIKTDSTFISAGTELAGYVGLNPGKPLPGEPDYPIRTGYCNVGRVIEAGADVRAFEAGDRVFSFARHASHHVLSADSSTGFVVSLPAGIPSHVGAASWMGGIALTSLQASSVSLNDWVAVFGLGVVGNLADQLFRLSGARVIGIDPVEARRRLAERVGIEQTAGGSEPAEETIQRLCGPDGAGITVEAVGDSKVAQQAAALTAPSGQLILLGTQRAGYQTDVTDFMRPIHWKWLDVKGGAGLENSAASGPWNQTFQLRQRAVGVRSRRPGKARSRKAHIASHDAGGRGKGVRSFAKRQRILFRSGFGLVGLNSQPVA